MTFRRKVVFLLLLVQIGSIGTLAALLYPRINDEELRGLRQRVTSIASTASLMIDGDIHQMIRPERASYALPQYQALQLQRKKVLSANPGVSYVWTMIHSDKPGRLWIIGDVGGGQGLDTRGPGKPYDASHIPDLAEGFSFPTADRNPVRDPWGVSVSGYAPIRNRAGEVVGIIGADIYDQQLYELRGQFRSYVLLCLLAAILVSLILGELAATRIAKPLKQLAHGMKRVEHGDLTHQVEVTSHDEFQETAESFNRMTQALREAREEIKRAFLNTVRSLMTALEAKDPYTRGHSVSVTRYATEIAKIMSKSPEEILRLEQLAVLHDIGKIGIHDVMLQKPGSLTSEERVSMQQHPVIGAKILEPLGLTEDELSIILHHHEREDGAGYPHGIERGKISDLVAIVIAADSYDAMTTHRPYRKPLKPADALTELKKHSGTQFRPEIVAALEIYLEKKGLLC